MTTTTSNRGTQLEAVCISLLVLCLVTVSLRVYTMAFILKRFFVEDYLAILTLVSPTCLFQIYFKDSLPRLATFQ